MYASRFIEAGETILVERPFVLTVSHAARTQFCAHCLANSLPGKAGWDIQCHGCGTQFYCSNECLKAAGPRHTGVECEALAAANAARLDEDEIDTVFQFIRILSDRLHAWSCDVGPAGVCGAGNSHAERLVGVTPSTDAARSNLLRICSATLSCLAPPARIPPAELLDLLERHSCNLYGVTGAAGEDVASASFVGFFHLFNHSCYPNVVFDSACKVAPAKADGSAPCFALRALFDIQCGDELNISYTSSADGPTQRSEHLVEHYGFECACARCACGDVGQELDFADALEAKRCTREECGSGFGVPGHAFRADALRCVHCGLEFECETAY